MHFLDIFWPLRVIPVLLPLSVPLSAMADEIVLCSGGSISFSNVNGDFQVTAVNDRERVVAWETGEKRILPTRRRERWNGSLGLVYPGGDEDIHVVYEEGMQFFSSLEDAQNWIFWRNDQMSYVANEGGIVVGGYTVPNDEGGSVAAVLLQVWQFVIDSKVPDSFRLSTSDGEASGPGIELEGEVCAMRGRSDLQKASRGKWINGRFFSGKVLDLLAETRATIADVERCIEHGIRAPHGQFESCTWVGEPFLWVMFDDSGRVLMAGVR
ncbi:MAG: hypothetical protein N838_14445 [Thiohalocapsa sp. PB-PSB1]|jgi:hypothetical protein|nr:MAG: hypothetical protein N838_09205 [Thiohalocapsa sp. PB-PSB1]QQO54361.1 MAG: hypothetical protein N838_14445 [Thiohalocapsa sp. PB-PSB1]